MAIDHYENFPVASILLPRRLVPAVEAIYAFARSADDLADEGDATPEQRLAALQEYERQLDLIGAGVHVCATSDGPFSRGKDVLVIGGGNSAGEESVFLTRFASKVTIVMRQAAVIVATSLSRERSLRRAMHHAEIAASGMR